MAHRRFLFTVRLKNRPVRFSRIGLFSEVLMEHHKLRICSNFYYRNCDRQTIVDSPRLWECTIICLSVISAIKMWAIGYVGYILEPSLYVYDANVTDYTVPIRRPRGKFQ